jgi:competence ComEA-like helix-hairpin-helix protein
VEPSAVTFSRDETRALGFIALLLALSAGVRLLDRPRPLQLDAAAVDIGALEAASRGEAAAGGRPQPLGPGERIDPNTASREDLLRLPRMRPALADALIRAREAAPLQTLEDVDRVPGVGPATLDAWRDHLRLQTSTTPAALAPPAWPMTQPALAGRPVSLSSATAAELETLPGVGPAIAARIIAWRDSAGGFRTLEDLMKVRGIGPASFARLKPLLTP